MKEQDKQILKDLIRLTNERVHEAVGRTMQLLDDSVEPTVVERAMHSLFERLVGITITSIEDEVGRRPDPDSIVALLLGRMATKFAPGWLDVAKEMKEAQEKAAKKAAKAADKP